jgi:hypothetical protein
LDELQSHIVKIAKEMREEELMEFLSLSTHQERPRTNDIFEAYLEKTSIYSMIHFESLSKKQKRR